MIGDIRHFGLFFALELVTDLETKDPATAEALAIVNGMKEDGVLLSSVGRGRQVIKIRPPLPFSKTEADILVNTLEKQLKKVTKGAMIPFEKAPLEEKIARFAQLGRSALNAWGIDGKTADLSLIKYRENGVFKVVSGDAMYALRIHRPGYHSLPALRSELQWMDALKQADIPVPNVISTTEGQLLTTAETIGGPGPCQVDLFEWIDGEMMDVVVEKMGDDTAALADLYQQVGQVAAKLHNQAVAWELPAGFARHAWDAEGLTGETPFWGNFWELDKLTAVQLDLIQRARHAVHEDLLSFGQDNEHYSLIHADFDQANLMVSNGRVQVIDFDDAGFGWHLFELATALYFLQNEPFYDDIKAALIAGYRENRALTDEHLSHLPLFLAARGFTYLGWIHTRPETETAQDAWPFLVSLCGETAERYLSWRNR